MKSLGKPWLAEGCGGRGGAGDDIWHKSRAQAVCLSPEAATVAAATAHLHEEDVPIRFRTSISSPA